VEGKTTLAVLTSYVGVGERLRRSGPQRNQVIFWSEEARFGFPCRISELWKLRLRFGFMLQG
jgi:hypothetical protein